MSERMGKYWICDSCAALRDWKPFKSAYTVTLGMCSWCNSDEEGRMTPLRDLMTKDEKRADCVDER